MPTIQNYQNYNYNYKEELQSEIESLREYVKSTATAPQYEAITSDRELTVVSAGAGTGKTWTLAMRFVWAVLTRENLDVRNILTLTFTDKAAGEMRDRIKKLLELSPDEDRGGKLKKALSGSKILEGRRVEALKNLPQAYISTIHSFCVHVIAEAGLNLPIDSGRSVISEAQTDSFWTELSGALDRQDEEWFTNGLGNDREYQKAVSEILNDPRCSLILNQWGAGTLAKFAQSFIEQKADSGETPQTILRELDNDLSGVIEQLRGVMLPNFEPVIRAFAALPQVLGELNIERDKTKKGKEQLAPFYHKWCGKDVYELDNEDKLEFALDVLSALKGLPSSRDFEKNSLGNKILASPDIFVPDEDNLKTFRDKFKFDENLLQLVKKGSSWPKEDLELRAMLIRIAWVAWQKWENHKDRIGCFTFSDMISLANQAIKSAPQYAARFKELLVDEFQDTNQLQDNLLTGIRIASGVRSKLFIVGDLKQSIYRFRHAEPGLFQKYINLAREGKSAAGAPFGTGCYVSMMESFRSNERVIDAVNSRFSVIWKERLGAELNDSYEELSQAPGKDAFPKGDIPVAEALFESTQKPTENSTQNDKKSEKKGEKKSEKKSDNEEISEKQEKLSKSEIRLRIARRLARRLLMLHGSAKLRDKKTSQLRPLEWQDIAVLVPTRNSYDSLQTAFDELGVPAVFNQNKTFFKRMEIRDICSLVEFLGDTGDCTALAGFLCSPFSGLSVDEGQALVAKLDKKSPLESLKRENAPLGERIENLIRISMLNGASAALGHLLANGDLLGHGQLLAQVSPRKRLPSLVNLRLAIKKLEEYESTVAFSTLGAASYLRRALRNESDTVEASAEDTENAVKIMTIHASKGLEFGLVAVFSLDHKLQGERDAILPSQTIAAAANKLPDGWPSSNERGAEPEAQAASGKKAKNCLLKLVHSTLEKQAEYEELQRLYYVALTRARDGFILCGIVPNDGAVPPKELSYLAIESQATKRALLPNLEADSAKEPSVLAFSAPNATTPSEKDFGKILTLPRREHSLRNISATSWALWNMCPAAWRTSHRQGLDLSWNAGKSSAAVSATLDKLNKKGENEVGGIDLGNLAHWILSRWDFSPENAMRLLASKDIYLKPELRALWRSEKAKAELSSFFLENFNTDPGKILLSRLKKAQANRALEREYPFKVKLESGLELNGAVDVFWLERDELGKPARLCVRDYKTTRIPDDKKHWAQIKKLYEEQLKFYALALYLQHAEYSDLEFDLALWNLRNGQEDSTIVMTAPDMKALAGELSAKLVKMSSEAASGSWERREKAACGSCPFAGECIFRESKQPNGA